MILSLSKEVTIYQLMWNNQDKTFIFRPPWIFSLSSQLKRRLWKYLECIPPLGRTGQRYTTICWTKLDPCLTQHCGWKAAAEKTELCERLFAHSTATALGSCPEVLLHQRRQASSYRDRTGSLPCKQSWDSPAQQSVHREQWPCLSSRKWGAVTPSCSTHGTDSSIF